jgi:hypothetical protein
MCPNTTVTLLRPSLPDPKANILIDNNGHARLADFGPSGRQAANLRY